MDLVVFCSILISISSLVAANDIEYHLLEEEPPNTFVGNIADDTSLKSTLNASEFNRLQFEILKEGNPYADWFSIDKKTGQVESTERIDRESICASLSRCILGLDIQIYMEDKDDPDNLELYQAFPISIILDDLNDNSPEFAKSELALSLPESSEIGYVLFISTASDLDSGINNGVQDYALIAEDDTFILQKPGSNGDNLGISVNKQLDREKQSSYNLTVIAKDGGIPVRSGSVSIHVNILDTNDNFPIFEQTNYDVSIPENQPIGKVVLKVTAKDIDVGENGQVFYKFSSRVSQRVADLFDVNRTSGEIKVKNIIDFEVDKEFQFVVEAFDQGTTSNTAQALCKITVTDVNDNFPKIHINVPPGGANIPESAEVNQYVAQIETNDPDSGERGTVSCSLDNDFFKLESLSFGMYKIKLRRQLDREEIPVHNINITCSDNGNPQQSNTARLVVHVTDINDDFPEFDQKIYNVSIHENNNKGDVISFITATDEDFAENGLVTYHIEHDMDDDYFEIDPNSGLLSAAAVFDRELRSDYIIKVIAKDSGKTKILSGSATVHVAITDVNDGIPTFSENRYVFHIEEGQPLGTEIGNITVTDHDIGANGAISFQHNFPFSDIFVIDSATGIITTKVVLDRENKSSYIFDLNATDKGSPALKSTARIEIYVTDINDNAPLVTFPTSSNNSVYVQQLTPIGTVITRIIVTDADDGVNAELTYHIMQGDVRQIFKINNLTGVITVEKQIEDNDAGKYTLLIAVQDNGTHRRLTTWASLVLIVQDDDGQRNMIIAVAVATVTFALSAAMILTICVIKRRDILKEKANKMQYNSEKQNFITSWIKCLSTSTKDIQRMNMQEKIKDTNKDKNFKNGSDLQPIVPDSGSTSSEDSKYIGLCSSQNMTKIDNNMREKAGEISPREQDSGFGESLDRRGIQEPQAFQMEKNQFTTSYLDSRGIRIPSPYLETSLPSRCVKKNERPQFIRNVSFDDEVLREREREKSNIPLFSSFNYRSISDSGQNSSNLFTISEKCSNSLPQRQSYGFHSLQRNPHNITSKYSFRNASRRDLPPICATPEPENVETSDLQDVSYYNPSYSLERFSQSDININTRAIPENYSPRSDTYRHSPREDILMQSSRSDTWIPSSRSDTYIDNAQSNMYSRGNMQQDNIVLGDVINRDIVV